MTKKIETQADKMGDIRVAPTAIAAIASHALLTCYGVVGMASKNTLDEFTATLTRDPNHGITVHFDHREIVVDVYVVIQYGTRIISVADSVINSIRYNIEKSVGISVKQVNVFVKGLRVTDSDKSEPRQ
jgi:uncharacterized alkaline shock family protein YloU